MSPTPTMAADVGGTFENGKFAMTIGASWDMASFNQAIGDNFEWDIVTFPSNPTYGQWRSPLWTTAIGMSADTPYKDECWEYISYMSAQDKVCLLYTSPGTFTKSIKEPLISAECWMWPDM